MLHFYKANVLRVVDGDTVVLSIDNGFHNRYETSVRLLGFDAPEVRTLNPEEKILGFKAKYKLIDLLAEYEQIYVRTEKADSFGRWLGILYVDIDKVICVNDIMRDYCDELRVPPSEETPLLKDD